MNILFFAAVKKQIPVKITYHQNAVSSGVQVLFIKSKISVTLFSRNTQAWPDTKRQDLGLSTLDWYTKRFT